MKCLNYFSSQENKLDDHSLYFILEGEIDLFLNYGSLSFPKKIRTLSNGDSFGLVSFLTASKRTATALSKNKSQIYKISRDNFL